VGLVGWRGMVGSVLMDRMRPKATSRSSSRCSSAPATPAARCRRRSPFAKNETTLHDANDIEALKRCDIIITCQGGDYTKAVYPQLRAAGWKGYWIDAAKTLRMQDDAVIILDPVNMPVIQKRWPRACATTSAATAPSAAC
jgi:aspartate-semialdehyde dehydrogenase